MNYLIITSLIVMLFSCSSTNHDEAQSHINLKVTQPPIKLSTFITVNRFPPRYPMKEASSGIQGCATVEYVVTREQKIKDVRVIDSTNKNFAKEAKKVVSKWDWTGLKSDLLKSSLKAQTRFEYCLEDGSGSCSMSNLLAKTQCSGSDVVASIGYRVK